MMPKNPDEPSIPTQGAPLTEIVIQAGDWTVLPNISELIAEALAVTVKTASLKFPAEAELSLVLSDDDHMRELNYSWRKIDKPTNVLSFPVEDIAVGEMPGLLMGDIVLSIDTLTREADEMGISIDHHLSHLVIHGFLHIFGYDHIENKDAEIMEALEITCLDQLGISNPYTASLV